MYKEKLATLTTICDVEIGRYISFLSILLLFQAKAIALAAKNGEDVCVCGFNSEYLQCIETLFKVMSLLRFWTF